MKRQSVRFVTAAMAVAAVAGCFSDPASSLRNGPADISLSKTTVYFTAVGESTQVEAILLDAQGNSLPIDGATWTTDNPAVADVHVAALQLPENGSSRAYIVAATANGAVTTVRISAQGISDSVRVTTVPNTTFPAGAAAVSGDTITITAPAGYTFDPAASTVTLGANTTYLVSRSATVLKVMARAPFTGAAVVHNLFFSGGVGGNAVPVAALPTNEVNLTLAAATLPAASVSVGNSTTFGNNTRLKVVPPAGLKFDPANSAFVLSTTNPVANSALVVRTPDSLVAILARPYTGAVMVTKLVVTATNATVDSLRTTAATTTVAAATLPAANIVVRTGPLGANTEMKATLPAGMTFSATASNVVLGTNNGTKLVNLPDSLVIISTNAYTGPVKLTNVNITATGRVLDSISTTVPSTIAAAPFPGTVTLRGTGRLLDTVLVIGGAQADFTTTGANASNVVIAGGTALVLRRAPDTLYVFATMAGTSAVTVTNVVVGTATVGTMSTAGNVTIQNATAETGEPANNTPGSVVISLATATQANPLIYYGTVDDGATGDIDDFRGFTLATARTVTLRLDFTGSGNAGAGGVNGGTNPDLDVYVCNATCSAVIGGFGGAGSSQPESYSITNLPAGTYNITVEAFATGGKTISYRLTVF